MSNQQQRVVAFIETKIFKRTPTYLEVKSLILNIFMLALLFIVASLTAKYYYDGWTILEGIYFLWICLTTVGFGDYMVNNGKPTYDGETVKTLTLRFNVLLLVIGLCQVSCILVSIQSAIEMKMVNEVADTDIGESNEAKEVEHQTTVLSKDNEGCDVEMRSVCEQDEK